MSTLLGSIFERWTLALTEMSWRGLLVFSVASVVVLGMALCRASAAARHLVWATAIVASLGVAIVGPVSPSWTLELPLATATQSPAPEPLDLPLVFAEIHSANLTGDRVTETTPAAASVLPLSATASAE